MAEVRKLNFQHSAYKRR